MRRLAALAILAAGCSDGGPAVRSGSAPAPPRGVACAAAPAVVRVGEPSRVRCQSPLPAANWTVSPPLGRLAPGLFEATFVLGPGEVGAGFGDTELRVGAAFGSGQAWATGSAPLTVLGNEWIGRSDAAAFDAFASDGSPLGAVAAALAGPPLALAARADGAVLAAQDPQGGPPVLALGRGGEVVGAFDARDASGLSLFDAARPPRAILQLRDGTVWVTGGRGPVVYDARGRFLRRAADAPGDTLGIAQLPGGAVALTYQWANAVAIYTEGGALLATLPLEHSLPPGEGLGSLGALALDPQGRLVAAAAHFHALGFDGTAVRLALGAAAQVEAELAAGHRVPFNVPRELARAGADFVSAPSDPVASTRPACPWRFAADLSGSSGCAAPGTSYRPVAHLGPSR